MSEAAASAPAASRAVTRVMICEDSLTVQSALSKMLAGEPDISVVARAVNGRVALDMLPRHPVDVVLLDIEMPVMDGLTALPRLLRADPDLRVIMASNLTTRGAEIALAALRLGAADYIPKPSFGAFSQSWFRQELIAKIRGLGRLRRREAAPAPAVALRGEGRRPRLLAIAASTGGPQALFELLPQLGPHLSVPVVITQHMPEPFTKSLAQHVGRISGLPTVEASNGERLRAGQVYIAPGNKHLLIEARGEGLAARLSDGPPENFCRPSADPMLRSAVAAVGGAILGVVLTGMGHDGLAGARLLVEAGGTVLAQDAATSVVWGMPGAVARAGLCNGVLPLPMLPARIMELIGR